MNNTDFLVKNEKKMRMKKRDDDRCSECGSLDCFITCTSDLREEVLCLCGLICENCGHVFCCANCGVWEDENCIIKHEGFCIDKE